MDELRSLLSTNQSDRLKREKAALDRIDDPKLPRHTVYQGDRKIQQLGQDTIENGVIINNQSLAIGETVVPLAKGNVLRRVDKTNGGALLGTAYRDALENDFDANGGLRTKPLSRNGGNEPSDPNSPNKPRKPSDRVPPPSGCVPPSKDCFWSSNPVPPLGFQNYGDAVVNENAQPTYLHCKAGTSVPANLGCDFLDTPPAPPVTTYSCSGGVCSLDPIGVYPSLAACQAALIPPPITGGQCASFPYTVAFKITYTDTSIRYWLNNGANTILSDLVAAFGLPYLQGAGVATQSGPIVPSQFTTDGSSIFRNGLSLFFVGVGAIQSFSLYQVFPLAGNTDNCGDPLPSCPI